ncbi:perilipin-2-like [Argonauta hians]
MEEKQNNEDATNTATGSGNQAQFAKRISSLPVVESTWAQLSSYYNKAKGYNSLMKFACDTAENGAKTVLNTAQPVLDKCQKQINAADTFACHQLDKLEEKCPVIKKKPEEIVTDGKQICSNIVQPALDKVNCVKQMGSTTMDNVKYFCSLENSKEYSKQQIVRASNYTYGQLQWMLQTDYGQQLLHQVEMYMTYSEDALDKYLPADNDPEDLENGETIKGVSTTRVANLSQKLKRRVHAKAMKEIENAQTRSKETLNNLIASYTLIQTLQQNLSKEKFQEVQEKCLATWKQVISEEDPFEGKSFNEKTSNEIVITLARHVSKQTQDTIQFLSSNLPETPEIVKQLVQESQQYSQNLYNTIQNTDSVKDISSALYQKTTDSLSGLQQIFSTLLNTPLSYITSLPKDSEVEMISEQPSDKTPEKTIPEKTIPEKTTPEKTTPEKTTPEKTTPEKTTPEKSTPEKSPENTEE